MLKDTINKLKKEKNLTNEQLSKLSGVPKSTIAKITSGLTPSPKLETLKALSTALGCTLDDFDDNKTNSDDIPESFVINSKKEIHLIYNFRNLNPQGQDLVLQIIDGIKDKYKKSDSPSVLEESV